MGSHLSVGIELHDDPGGLLLGDADELHDVGVVQLLHQHCGKRGIPTLEWGIPIPGVPIPVPGDGGGAGGIVQDSPKGWELLVFRDGQPHPGIPAASPLQ